MTAASRATDRHRPGRVVAKGRETRWKTSGAARAGADTSTRVRTLPIRHRTGKATKRIQTASDDTVGRLLRKWREIKGSWTNNHRGPSEAVLIETKP